MRWAAVNVTTPRRPTGPKRRIDRSSHVVKVVFLFPFFFWLSFFFLAHISPVLVKPILCSSPCQCLCLRLSLSLSLCVCITANTAPIVDVWPRPIKSRPSKETVKYSTLLSTAVFHFFHVRPHCWEKIAEGPTPAALTTINLSPLLNPKIFINWSLISTVGSNSNI